MDDEVESQFITQRALKKYLITFSLKNLGPLKILNDSIWILNQFGIIQNLQRSPVPQTSKCSGTLLGTGYDTPALVVTTFIF